jgi:LysM repeat protein
MQTLPRRPGGALAVLLLAGLLSACSPWLDSPREDDHPLINEAVARKALSPREAERLLEKALEANPRLARAHWELALIRLNQTSNYAAAVYHFQKVLELRPDWPHANTARQLITQAKLELVKDGIELPTLPTVQRQIDRYVAEIHRLNGALTNLQAQVRGLTVVTQQLTAQNLQLRQQLLAVASSPAAPQTPVQPAEVTSTPARESPATASPAASRTAPAAGSRTQPAPLTTAAASGSERRPVAKNPSASAPPAGKPGPAAPVSGGGRTHTFRPGETARSVAERYHLTLRDLMRANPGVNLNQVKAGQTIRLP